MQLVAIYVTTKDAEQAKKIGETLLQERLAACVNILGTIESIYWWEGNIDRASETSMIIKTREAHIQKVIERVKELHTYTVPCVVALKILDGNPDFLKWVERETGSENENVV